MHKLLSSFCRKRWVPLHGSLWEMRRPFQFLLQTMIIKFSYETFLQHPRNRLVNIFIQSRGNLPDDADAWICDVNPKPAPDDWQLHIQTPECATRRCIGIRCLLCMQIIRHLCGLLPCAACTVILFITHTAQATMSSWSIHTYMHTYVYICFMRRASLCCMHRHLNHHAYCAGLPGRRDLLLRQHWW
jgi:hypothetical protein